MSLKIRKKTKSTIDFESRWFQVFDFLFRNYNLPVPSGSDKYIVFISELEKNKPEIFSKLIKHLNDYSAEKILIIFKEGGKNFERKIT